VTIPLLPSTFDKPALELKFNVPKRSHKNSIGQVDVGGRHNALVSQAGRARNRGLEGDELAAELLEINSTFEKPLEVEEVLQIALWADSKEGGDGFVRNDKGQIVRDNLANVTLAVDRLGVTLRYNAFADRITIEGLSETLDGQLTDPAVRRLWFFVEESFGFRSTQSFFLEAVYDIAHQNSFDPLCDELDALEAKWDGTARLDTWLSTYGGAEDSPLVRSIGAKTLIGAVRRARQPGVKFDTMLVLVGDQGCGKSTACSILAGDPDKFSDYVPFNAAAREVIEALSGRWIIEAGELAGMGKASAEKRKSFLSRSVDHGRAAYARVPEAVKRRCVFIGTTNADTFLTDGTGNRRFWPVEVGSFDLESLARDRDQIIAEAAVREAAGESLVLPGNLWSVAAELQNARRIENPLVSALQDKLGDRTGRIKSADVWRMLNIPAAQQTALAGMVSNAMQELGWKSGQYRFGGKNSERGYANGTELEQKRRLTVGPMGGLFEEGSLDLPRVLNN
jgi:hypothetical protein